MVLKLRSLLAGPMRKMVGPPPSTSETEAAFRWAGTDAESPAGVDAEPPGRADVRQGPLPAALEPLERSSVPERRSAGAAGGGGQLPVEGAGSAERGAPAAARYRRASSSLEDVVRVPLLADSVQLPISIDVDAEEANDENGDKYTAWRSIFIELYKRVGEGEDADDKPVFNIPGLVRAAIQTEWA